MAGKYKDYIKIESDFIPVFSRNSDKIYPDKWQSFYPHESFKKILVDVVESLEKSSESKDRSIWMSGAYGTGKTFASFVVKHILEDDIDTIETYLNKHGMQSLLSRIKGIRSKGKTLVVQRSSSGGIMSQDMLFYAIIDSVRAALDDAELKYKGGESLSEKILTMLENPKSSAFNFEGAFNKHKAKFVQYESVNGIIKDLKELSGDEKLDLLGTIIDVAAQEGFYWSMSTDELINWLEDIKNKNNLHAILFIWDEFTEYFRNNPTAITGLQELAMASSRINYYLFLITHSKVGQLVSDKKQQSILEARFKNDDIELAEGTAFTLLGQAISHEKDLETEWEGIAKDLWGGVKRESFDVLSKKDDLNEKDFKGLLPMHPYAAYLLKYIAKDISSNQRTIFQFLSGDFSGDDNKKNFKWFIENFEYDYGNWNYLTADFLWDYFFLGDVNLDQTFVQALGHYNNFSPLCEDKDNSGITERRQRILKTTLLLCALQIKNGAESSKGAISLLRPTLKNIKACFAGTPYALFVEQDLGFLSSKGIIGKIDHTNDTLFVMTSATIDEERWKKIHEVVKHELTFEKIIADQNAGIINNFLPNDYLKYRLKPYYVSVSNAKEVAGKIIPEENYIPLIFVFAKKDGDKVKIQETVRQIYDAVGDRCIVADFTDKPFTESLFDKFIKSKTDEKYFQTIPNQNSQFKYAQDQAKEHLKSWSKELNNASINVYSTGNKAEQRAGQINFKKELKELNTKFYGAGLEEIIQLDTAFADKGFKETVAQMGMGKTDIPNNYAYLKHIKKLLEKDGIWNDPEYYKNQPHHPVSKMKLAIDKAINKSFANTSMVTLTAIWDELIKPPFGLMPNGGSIFLMGFLLKEYADSNYYKRDDNNNTNPLNYSDLGDLIFGVVKGLQKADKQYIVKQTPAQAHFCKATGNIFKIDINKRNSVDDIAKNINAFLTKNAYPLWSMKYYIEEELHDHQYKDELLKLTDLLCEFIKAETNTSRDRKKIVDDIYEVYRDYPTIENIYADILSAKNMRAGMVNHIAEYKPDLVILSGNLQLEENEYLELLNKKLSSDSYYLWEQEDTDRQIDNVYTDLKLINAINSVLHTKTKDYVSARLSLGSRLSHIKVPYMLLKEFKPNLVPLFEEFFKIKDDDALNKADAGMLISNMSDDFLEFFNNQADTFKIAAERVLKTKLTEDELSHLFNNISTGALFGTIDVFKEEIEQELKKYRKKQKTQKMYNAWKDLTKSQSPTDWSKVHGIPVLCLFTDNITKAQRIFDALNKTSYLPTDSDIDEAIAFLSSGALNKLSDISSCEKQFIELFAGEYAYIISSADELRDRLRETCGSNIYDWYAKANNDTVKENIKNYALQKYKHSFCSKAKDKVSTLTAADAQKYLNELIENDPLLGIRILKG